MGISNVISVFRGGKFLDFSSARGGTLCLEYLRCFGARDDKATRATQAECRERRVTESPNTSGVCGFFRREVPLKVKLFPKE